MMYRLKCEFHTKGKIYPAGSILPDDTSDVDVAFLKSKKFIEPADLDDIVVDDSDEDDDEDLFGGDELGQFKSKEEIEKLRKKEDVYVYAKSIGCDLGYNYEEKQLKDLKNTVIDFQEEQESFLEE